MTVYSKISSVVGIGCYLLIAVRRSVRVGQRSAGFRTKISPGRKKRSSSRAIPKVSSISSLVTR